ncbi:MAG: hypothetical protein LBT40_12495 [Deltaproteobacteria bacterium]|jgi:hypothetical protein|nr:hypothetical protein [Deltaproteobacteria bacterium]
MTEYTISGPEGAFGSIRFGEGCGVADVLELCQDRLVEEGGKSAAAGHLKAAIGLLRGEAEESTGR